MEIDWASELVNPNGMSLAGGAETVLAGLEWVLYKDKAGFINNFTVGMIGVADITGGSGWQGYWAGFQPSQNSGLFDYAWLAHGSVTFGQYWTLSDSYLQAYSADVSAPVANGGNGYLGPFGAIGFPVLRENDLRLTLTDTFTGWPITFNPYVQWSYYFQSGFGGADGGASAAGFSESTNAPGVATYDFFIGMTPTFNAQKYWGVPLTFKAPTYVTVGPQSFWNAQCATAAATAAAFATSASNFCSSGSIGVFTTGLTAIYDMKWVPANYGAWSVKAGFQWYDLVNNALVGGNILSVGNSSRDTVIGFVGMTVGF